MGKAILEWGRDDKNFGELMREDSKRADTWRKDCAKIITAVKPDTSGTTIYRGGSSTRSNSMTSS